MSAFARLLNGPGPIRKTSFGPVTKPAEDGAGLVVRVLNPTDAACEAALRLGFPFASAEPVRLDETPAGGDVAREADTLRFAVPAHALRSVRIR
jgi:hypothetical protein